jgi:hypothetical protein
MINLLYLGTIAIVSTSEIRVREGFPSLLTLGRDALGWFAKASVQRCQEAGKREGHLARTGASGDVEKAALNRGHLGNRLCVLFIGLDLGKTREYLVEIILQNRIAARPLSIPNLASESHRVIDRSARRNKPPQERHKIQ